MNQSYQVFICDSHRAKIHGGGCCNDKGAESLLQSFSSMIEEANLSRKVSISPSLCMANCPNGISMRIMPGNVLYSRVKLQDLAEIIREHILKGEPVTRLLRAPVRRFSGLLD